MSIDKRIEERAMEIVRNGLCGWESEWSFRVGTDHPAFKHRISTFRLIEAIERCLREFSGDGAISRKSFEDALAFKKESLVQEVAGRIEARVVRLALQEGDKNEA